MKGKRRYERARGKYRWQHSFAGETPLSLVIKTIFFCLCCVAALKKNHMTAATEKPVSDGVCLGVCVDPNSCDGEKSRRISSQLPDLWICLLPFLPAFCPRVPPSLPPLTPLSGLEFPWGPKPFAEVVAGPLLRNNRQTTDSSSLEGHYVGVYFSAHWVSSAFVCPSAYMKH